jgi:2-methylcitrate dehydratase PrpD
VDPAIESRWPNTLEIGVIATDRKGDVHEVRAFDPKGLYNNRMDRDDLYEKFSALAVENDSIRDAGSVFDTLWRISDAERAAEVVRAIAES